jgi:hypothetical protein
MEGSNYYLCIVRIRRNKDIVIKVKESSSIRVSPCWKS